MLLFKILIFLVRSYGLTTTVGSAVGHATGMEEEAGGSTGLGAAMPEPAESPTGLGTTGLGTTGAGGVILLAPPTILLMVPELVRAGSGLNPEFCPAIGSREFSR